MRKVMKVLAFVSLALFLYSCGILPSAENPQAGGITLKDEAGNVYAIPVEINGKVYQPAKDGKIHVDLADGTYTLKLVGVSVFKDTYTMTIINKEAEVILEKTDKPAVDVLVKNGKRTLIVANLAGYKGIELKMEYSGSGDRDIRDFDSYIGVYTNRLVFFGAKKNGHLSNWMELPAQDAWKDIKVVYGYTYDGEKVPIDVK